MQESPLAVFLFIFLRDARTIPETKLYNICGHSNNEGILQLKVPDKNFFFMLRYSQKHVLFFDYFMNAQKNNKSIAAAPWSFDIWLYGTLGLLFTHLWNVFKEYHGMAIKLEGIIYFLW